MRIQIILNPRSKLSGDEKLLNLMREKFAGHLAAMTITTSSQDALDIALRAPRDDIDTLVVVGGDGTVNGVLNGLAGTAIALAVIPHGTANDLASFYAMPTDVAAACDVILKRCLRRIDLISVNGRYYATGGGFGMPCRVAELANALKRGATLGGGLRAVLGGRLYVFAALWTLLWERSPRNRLSLRWHGGNLTADVLALMINNQPFLGKHFLLSPDAVGDDGMFDICLIENRRASAQIVPILLKVLDGRHEVCPSVACWRAKEILITAERPVNFFADGDVLFQTTNFAITVAPAALDIIVPAPAAAATAYSRTCSQARHPVSEENEKCAA